MTLYIIILSGIVSILAFSYPELLNRFQFNAYRIKHKNELYRFVTYGFVHADWIHMGVNLFVLYSFGGVVEMFYGSIFLRGGFYYLLLYTGGLIFSTLSSYLKNKDNLYYNAVGASGAVSAVLFTSILFNPEAKIGILFLPFDMPAVVFGILYLVYSAYMAKKGKDNIGHDAHFWGAVYGMVFTIALKPSVAVVFIERVAGLLGC